MFRWLICCLVFPSTLSAQVTADALHHDLLEAQQDNRYYDVGNALSELGYFYLSTHYDSAYFYYHKALRYNRRYNHEDLIAHNLNDLGLLSSNLGRPDSAAYFYNRAIEAYRQTPDSLKAIETHANLAIIYKNLDMYPAALSESFIILPKLESNPRLKALGSCYNTIASVYGRMKNFPEAMRYHKKALRIRLDSAYKKGVAQSYNNIGILFSDFQLYDSALWYFQSALVLKIKLGESVASAYQNIGDLYMDQHIPDSAEAYLTKALQVRRERKDISGLPATLNALARLELEGQNFLRAQQYLDESESLGLQVKQPQDLAQTFQLQSELFEKTKNVLHALVYLKKLDSIQNTLLNQGVFNKTLSVAVAYEHGRAQRDLDLKQAEIEVKKIWITSLTIGILLLAIIGTLIYSQLTLTRKSKAKVETLLKELHHRVKNNLQLLSSLFAVQSSHLTDSEAIIALKTSEGRINTMAIIHKKLYRNDSTREVNLRDYFKELIDYLLYSYGYHQAGRMLEMQLTNRTLDVDVVIPLGLIVNEIVSNALKYAYTNQPDPKLRVEILEQKNTLQLIIQDNGSGIPENIVNQKKSGFGLQIVHSLVHELKGTLTRKNHNGAHFYIIIPI